MRGPYVILAAIGAAGFWWWRRSVDLQELTETLDQALPQRLAQWAPQLARAATDTAPGELGARSWAFLLAAVMDRESNGGLLLKPRGAGGTGDGGHGRGLMQLDDRPYRGPDPEAQSAQSLTDMWRREQARTAIRMEVVESGAWADAEQNIRAGARHLRSYFDDELCETLDQAVAAYNAGPRVFLRPDPDTITTGGNYSRDTLARSARFEGAA